MLFISIDDFYQKIEGQKKLSREEEKHYAIKKNEGDADAHNQIVQSYLPMVAWRIRSAPKNIQSLHTLYRCLGVLDDAVHKFDFLQDNEPFVHYLSWCLRQCITQCIAERR